MIDVVILAAGSIKDKIYFLKYVFASPALIPVNSRALAAYVIDFYLQSQEKCRIHLVINSSDALIVQKELCNYSNDIDYVFVEKSRGVVDTLRIALRNINSKDQVIINVVTTIPASLPAMDEVLISDKLARNRNWSSIVPDSSAVKFMSKQAMSENEGYAFTGVFRLHVEHLARAVESINDYGDLLSVVSAVHSVHPLIFRKTHWIDCGHETNYYRAKQQLITSRSINAVQINGETGVITKSSLHKDKLRNEVNYILMLPKEVAVYFPRILGGYQEQDGRGSFDMEYYGYPTLAELMLYWDLDLGFWDEIFSGLTVVLEHFRKHPYSIGISAFMDFYFKKTQDRIAEFRNRTSYEWAGLFNDTLVINGTEYSNYNVIRSRIEERIRSLYKEQDFCIMHGDFCFNNILYDLNSGILRLIDARGSFGNSCVGIYGDFKYDLAKLTHSVIGGYDFIVNGSFRLSADRNCFTYAINVRDTVGYLADRNRELIRRFGFKESDMLFLIGLLFVSMCPIHQDAPRRQAVMYLHGIKYLNETLEADE